MYSVLWNIVRFFAKLLKKKIGFNHFVNDSIVLHEFPFNEEEKKKERPGKEEPREEDKK